MSSEQNDEKKTVRVLSNCSSFSSSPCRLCLRLSPVAIALTGCIVLVVGCQTKQPPKLHDQLISSGICMFFIGLVLFVFINCCDCFSVCNLRCWRSEESIAAKDHDSPGISFSKEAENRVLGVAVCTHNTDLGEETTTTTGSNDCEASRV